MTGSELGPIFIFASGQRCGSTLLQRFLCSHPDVMIWGEHDGILSKMFTQFERLCQWEEMFGHQFQTFLDDGYHNFIPNMNPDRTVIQHAQTQLVRNLWEVPAQQLGKSVWGFKEVLYGAEMAFCLKRLFPGAKIIHLTRNIFDCFISLRHEETITPEMQLHVPVDQVWTRQRTIEFIDTWLTVNQSMLHTPGLDEEWVFRMTYEQLTEEPAAASRNLTDWLGLDFYAFDQEVFQYKLYTDRHKGPDPRPKVKRSDLTDDEIALVTTSDILSISQLLNFNMSVQ